MFKVITIVAQFCVFAAAIDCNSHPEACIEDETSLLQVARTISRHGQEKQDPGTNPLGYTFDKSQVEAGQDDLKAAQSNSSVQMYAQAQARLTEAQAIWAASKAHMKAEGATQKNINAERSAAAAVQSAQDEADAWAAAVQAYNEQVNTTRIAEADYNAKHSINSVAKTALDSADASLTAAKDNASVIEATQQMLVNDAAAEATANFSLDAKVVAASRVATQKEAQAKYNEEYKEAKEARKEERRKKLQAQKDEWNAHKASLKAQKSMEMKAAAAVMNPLINATETAKEVVSGLQTGSATVTDAPGVEANATRAVQEAQMSIDQAVSDKKKAKAAYDVAQWAEYVATNNMKTAQGKEDASYRKEQHLRRKAWEAAHNSRKALERARELNWELNSTYGWRSKNASAWETVARAENITYELADAVRNNKEALMRALANVKTAVNNGSYSNALQSAAAENATAQTTAENAMISRISAEYEHAYLQAVLKNLSAVKANLTDADVLSRDARKESYQAQGDARHAAWEAQKYDRKSAAANLADQPGSDVDTTVTTVETSVLG